MHGLCNFSFLDEASMCMLFSKYKNVGKTLTLKVIAFGQGAQNLSHPMVLAGGDQNVSGSSVYVQVKYYNSVY
jgi:hypothetical protein